MACVCVWSPGTLLDKLACVCELTGGCLPPSAAGGLLSVSEAETSYLKAQLVCLSLLLCYCLQWEAKHLLH